MKEVITRVWRFTLFILTIITMLVVIAWLFDSHPENLHWAWRRVTEVALTMFLINLLFGRRLI